LGMPWLLDRLSQLETSPTTTTDAPRPSSSIPEFSIAKEGDFWTLASPRGTFRLKDSRGLHILARLLSAPNEETHVLAFSASGDPGDVGDAGPVLDAEAIRAYK